MTFKITVLGSNSALPTTKGFPSAHVVNIHEHFFLIDCGEGTQIQLRRNKFNFNKIESIFISHLHGDHFFGIFGLLSTFNLLGRTKDLHIYSDSVLEKIIYTVIDFNTINYTINFHSLNFDTPEIIFENNSIIIKSFPLKHRINTCGFHFAEKEKSRKLKKEAVEKFKLSVVDILKIKAGKDFNTKTGEIIKNEELTQSPNPPRSYAYCSDTAFSEEIIDSIKNTDLLYHEATFSNEDEAIAKKTGHSTASQAANIAKNANAKKLLIGHFSTRYKTPEILLEQAKAIFENTLAVSSNDEFIL